MVHPMMPFNASKDAWQKTEVSLSSVQRSAFPNKVAEKGEGILIATNGLTTHTSSAAMGTHIYTNSLA